MINMLAAQLALSPIGYVVAGMLLAMGGVVLIAFTSNVPFVNILTSVIGWFLIVIGGMVMLYGVAPQFVLKLGVGVGFIILVIGAIIIVWHEINAMRRLRP